MVPATVPLGWRPLLCECGHTSGDHSATAHGLNVSRGQCWIDGCGCKLFVEKERAA